MKDKDAVFRVIYDETLTILMRIAWKIVLDQEIAEELCHDAYIKLYDRIHLFPDTDQAKYWLIRVVKNQSLNYAKRKQRERRAYEKILLETRHHSDSVETQVLKQEDCSAIQRAMLKLPEAMRVILIMKEYAELGYKDIAQALNISESNVKVRMFRARQKLAQIMEEGTSHG
jgi:RNA polymerase sigma factor (sigma-70 family)